MARKDPDRLELEGVTATPMKERGVDSEGKKYWRARTTGADRRTIWAGWGTRAQVSAVVGALVSKGIPAPSGDHGKSGTVRTVGDLVRRWLAAQELRHTAGDLAERSIASYRNVASHWIDAMSDLSTKAVTRARVEDQLTAWLALGVSPRSCKLAVDILTAAWRWGTDREHVTRLDLSKIGVAVPREDEHVYESRTPSREDIATILPYIADGRDRDLILLLGLTGARVGEVGALQVGSVDLPGRMLTISGRDRRRGRRGKVASRRWPITGELVALVQRLTRDRPRDASLIDELPTNVAALSRQILLDACEEAGVDRFTAHGLRRMVAMELVETGDAKSVSLLTGHSVAVLMRDYVRPRAASLHDLVTRSGVGSLETRGKVRKLRARKPGTDLDDDE